MALIFVILIKSCPLNEYTRNSDTVIDIESIYAKLDCNQYSDISRAQLQESTYSNSCVWPAGLEAIIITKALQYWSCPLNGD